MWTDSVPKGTPCAGEFFWWWKGWAVTSCAYHPEEEASLPIYTREHARGSPSWSKTAHPLGWSGEPKAHSTITQRVVMAFRKKMFLWHHNLVHHTYRCALEGIQHSTDRSSSSPPWQVEPIGYFAMNGLQFPKHTCQLLFPCLWTCCSFCSEQTHTHTHPHTSVHLYCYLQYLLSFIQFLPMGVNPKPQLSGLRNVSFIFLKFKIDSSLSPYSAKWIAN